MVKFTLWNWKFVLQLGKKIKAERNNLASNHTRRLGIWVGVLGIGIISIVIVGGYLLFKSYKAESLNEDQVLSLPPLLEGVDFPDQPTEYPSGWPEELIFPEPLMLVDTVSGRMPDSIQDGYSAKLRYAGTAEKAVSIIEDYLSNNDWSIAEKEKIEQGSFMLLIEKENGSGIILVEEDIKTSGVSYVLATMFP